MPASVRTPVRGAHRAAFNSAALAGQEVAIVCEALIDAMSFWAAGHRNVIAAYSEFSWVYASLDAGGISLLRALYRCRRPLSLSRRRC